jgi:hypothetical protein
MTRVGSQRQSKKKYIEQALLGRVIISEKIKFLSD